MSTTSAPRVLDWRAGISITRIGLDTVEEIDYEQCGFVRRFWIAPQPRPQQGTQMTADELAALHTELEAQIDNEPPGTDREPLHSFVELLEHVTGTTG